MREGPLAALFRNTDADGVGESPGGDRPQDGVRREPVERTPAERPRDTEPENGALRGGGYRREPEPEPPEPARPEPEPRRPEPGHRPLRPEPEAQPVRPEPPGPARGRYEGIPSPEERLRSVFSADIPENVLERTPQGDQRALGGEGAASEPDPYLAQERAEIQRPGASPVHDPVLRVVGVGGAGVNAVNRMIEAQVAGVEFVAVNTDLQSLEQSRAARRVHIGSEATRGLGSGADPELGRRSAIEQYDELKGLLKGADMVFVAAGAGGGTGTGAAPVVARIAREVGALVVGIVTKPFSFEGARRGVQAEVGVQELAAEVDTLITIPNSRLLTVLDKRTSMVEAFRVADDVLRQGVQGVSDLITLPGLINLDFADVRTIMSQAGNALLGIGMGSGEGRALEAAERAVESPLLETSVEGAQSILLSITGGPDLSLWEVNEAAKAVAEAAHPDANIIFGAMVDEKLVDEVWITVVATGYSEEPQPRRGRRPPVPEEADAEPRVTYAPQRRRPRPTALGDLDIPEFLPNGGKH